MSWSGSATFWESRCVSWNPAEALLATSPERTEQSSVNEHAAALGATLLVLEHLFGALELPMPAASGTETETEQISSST